MQSAQLYRRSTLAETARGLVKTLTCLHIQVGHLAIIGLRHQVHSPLHQLKQQCWSCREGAAPEAAQPGQAGLLQLYALLGHLEGQGHF